MRGARLLLAGLALLAACDRGAEPAAESGEGGAGAVVAATTEGELASWLGPTDATDPARWLAGREAGHPLPADDPHVRALQEALRRTKDGFIEDPRMIANRTAQLGGMLRELGVAEPAEGILSGFGGIAALRGRHKSLFGEMCQHYYNTRAQGADHATALARLAEAGARP
ncbi:MxaH protein [Methylobacterium sp. A54F]